MKIKLFKQICGAAGSYKEGQTADLPEDMAHALINGGYAEEITEKIEEPVIETTVAEVEFETTAKPVPKKKATPKKRGRK